MQRTVATLPEQDVSLAMTFSGVSMSLTGHVGWRCSVVKWALGQEFPLNWGFYSTSVSMSFRWFFYTSETWSLGSYLDINYFCLVHFKRIL